MPKKELGKLTYYVVEVEDITLGPLHATTPAKTSSQEYMLARQPSDSQLAKRRHAGEQIVPMQDLKALVVADTELPEGEPEETTAVSVFRRDSTNGNRPYIHSNFIKGHIRDAAAAVGRAIGFFGLKEFVTVSLFVTPAKIYIPKGTEIGVDRWPTHFDLRRHGRVSGFRQAEWAANPKLNYRLVLLGDSRWTPSLLTAIYTQGAIHGKGGGRRLDEGKYRFQLGAWEQVDAQTALEMMSDGIRPG